MPSIGDSVQEALDAHTVERISRRIGAPADATRDAVGSSVDVFLDALERNARSPRERRSLEKALRRDHDGSIAGRYRDEVEQMPLEPGDDILGHVFGKNRENVESALGARSGLNSGQIGQLLKMLAPLILGMLAKKMGQGGNVGREMKRDRRDARKQNPDLGDLVDDILGAGRNGRGEPTGGCLPMGR